MNSGREWELMMANRACKSHSELTEMSMTLSNGSGCFYVVRCSFHVWHRHVHKL